MKEPLKLSVGDQIRLKNHTPAGGTIGKFTRRDGYPAAMLNLWTFNFNSRSKGGKKVEKIIKSANLEPPELV